MNAVWRCGICETVNQSGTTCAACGAEMTRRSAVSASVRERLAPVPPLPDPSRPLPPPVERAINREAIDEEEWPYDDTSFRMIPVPGGCIMIRGPRA